MRAYHFRIPDEKGGEDLHQFVREETRRRRFKKLTAQRVAFVTNQARNPSERGMRQVTVPEETFEQMVPVEQEESMHDVFYGGPQHWTPELNGMLTHTRGVSESEASQAAGVSCWRWLRKFFKD